MKLTTLVAGLLCNRCSESFHYHLNRQVKQFWQVLRNFHHRHGHAGGKHRSRLECTTSKGRVKHIESEHRAYRAGRLRYLNASTHFRLMSESKLNESVPFVATHSAARLRMGS